MNESKDFLRTFWKRKIQLFDSKIENTYYDAESNIETHRLIELLKKIDKKFRIPLYLYYYEGYSIKELSKLLKCSESAVKMKVARGRKILKLKLEEK